jgi:hypothetical protein
MIIIQPSASRTTNPRAPIPSSKLLGYYHSSALRTDNSTFWAKSPHSIAPLLTRALFSSAVTCYRFSASRLVAPFESGD